MHKYLILAILLLMVIPLDLQAKESKDAYEEVTAPEVDIYEIPPILDPGFRHKKRGQLEFNPYISAYLGNAIGQTWQAGAHVYYHFNNTFALGGNWGISKLLTNRDSAFGRTITNPWMQMANAELMICNDAAMTVGKTMLEMDFYLTLGMGGMYLNGKWEPMGLIGGGAKFYTGLPWLAFRIDINSYVHNVKQTGRNVVDFDVAILGGPSILFPTNASAYEQKRKKK